MQHFFTQLYARLLPDYLESVTQAKSTAKRASRHTNTSFVFVLAAMLFSVSMAQAQVSVTATAGTVGPTAYTTINAAFTAINAGTHQGAVTITVTGNTTEPATAVPLLKSASPSSYTSISIRPSGGSWTVNSAAAPTASRGVIELNGADNVTIDGDPTNSGTRNLSFVVATNASTGTCAIRLASTSITGADGADNNTIKNCIITGGRNSATATTVSYGINMSNSSSITTGAYSSINTIIQNNLITRCYHGVYANGTSATYPNTGIQILSNTIGSSTAASNIGARGIYLTYSAVTAGATSAIIEKNDIRVGDVSAAGAGYAANIAGIEIGTVNSGAIIRYNNIHDVMQPNTGGYLAAGISITGATSCDNISIHNNFIRDMVASKYSATLTSSFENYGIYISAGATLIKINYNTIALLVANSTGTTANSTSACITATAGGATISQFQNNILVNNNVSTQGFGFYTQATTNISAGTVNNNDYYTVGANIGYYNTASQTFANWKTNTGKDASALNLNPTFLSATDLHLNYGTTANQFESGGATVSGITTDYDNQTRPGPTGSVNGGATAPDIGADEFDGVPLSAPNITSVSASPTGNSCTNVARTISATVVKTSNNITAVTLGYQVNGGTLNTVAMTGWAATGTSTATATIPTVSPSNGTVTWSVTVTDGTLTRSSTGTSYADEPLTGATLSATATPASMCAGGTASLSATITVANTPPASYCAATMSFTTEDDIGQVTFAGINNPATRPTPQQSNAAATGTYTDFTAVSPAVVNTGSSYPITVYHFHDGTNTTANFCNIYIDFNQNGLFTDAGEMFILSSGASFLNDFTGTIAIPSTATLGKTRMRVFLKEGAITNACTNGSWGEVEDYIVNIQGTPAGTTYAWSNGTNTASGNPATSVTTTLPSTYTVTATTASGCTITAVANTITAAAALSAVNVTAGTTTLCAGITTALTATPVDGCPSYTYAWTAPVNGTFSNAAISNPTFSSLVAGSYNLTCTVTDAAATVVSNSTITITVNAAPPAAISPSVTLLCGSGTSVLTASGGTTYAWAANATLSATNIATPTATPTATTTYTVTVTDGNSCTATAAQVITFAPAVSVTSSATPAAPCEGTNLALAAVGAVSGYTVSSIAVSAQTPSGTPVVLTTGGTAGVTLTQGTLDDGCWNNIALPFSFNYFGISYSTVRVSTNGTVQFGTIVTGGNPGSNSWTAQAIPTAGGYLDNFIAMPWFDHDPGSTPYGTIRYFVNGTAPNRQFVISYEAVKIYLQADVNTAQVILNEGTNTVDILLLGSGLTATNSKVMGIEGPGGTDGYTPAGRALGTWTTAADEAWRFTPLALTYAWAGPSYTNATQNPTITAITTAGTGTYTVTATAASGCTASSTVAVTVNPLPTVAITNNTGTTVVTCTTPSISVTATGGDTYAWSGGLGSSASASITTAGTYIVTATTTATGCTGTASITTTLDNTPPTAGITGAGSFCTGGSTTLTATGGGTYAWSNSSAVASSGSITVGGTYNVTVTAANGCTASSTAAVTVNAVPTAGITGTLGFCPSGSTTLTATGGGASYAWSNSSAIASSGAISTAGDYTVTVTSAAGCSATTSAAVVAFAAVSASLSSANNLTCTTTSSVLTAAGGATYDFGSGFTATATHTVMTGGTYTVTVQSADGCTANANVSVTSDTKAPLITIAKVASAALGLGEIVVTTQPANAMILWTSPSSTNKFLKKLANGNYSFIVTDPANGCTTTQPVTVP